MSSLASVSNLTLESPENPRYTRWALVRAWLPTLVWMGVIAFESTSIFTAEHTGAWLYAILNALFGPNVTAHTPMINALGRKFGHFTGYSILGGLSFYGWTEFLAYRTTNQLARLKRSVRLPRRWHLRAATLAVLTTFAVAALDEFHQAFVPGRTAAFHDVMLDTMGGVFAQILIMLIWDARRKKQRKPAPVLEMAGTSSK